MSDEVTGPPLAVVLFGVAGSGKTTVGQAVADRLAARGEPVDFIDADAFHSEANRAKMRAGIGLDEADRLPWLDAVRAAVIDRLAAGRGVVLACSALKRSHRDRLGMGLNVTWCWLDVPDAELADRLMRRRGHFAGPALLASQRAAFEAPAADEAVVRVDATGSVEAVAADVLRRGAARGAE